MNRITIFLCCMLCTSGMRASLPTPARVAPPSFSALKKHLEQIIPHEVLLLIAEYAPHTYQLLPIVGSSFMRYMRRGRAPSGFLIWTELRPDKTLFPRVMEYRLSRKNVAPTISNLAASRCMLGNTDDIISVMHPKAPAGSRWLNLEDEDYKRGNSGLLFRLLSEMNWSIEYHDADLVHAGQQTSQALLINTSITDFLKAWQHFCTHLANKKHAGVHQKDWCMGFDVVLDHTENTPCNTFLALQSECYMPVFSERSIES